jgi:hypothetical protein
VSKDAKVLWVCDNHLFLKFVLGFFFACGEQGWGLWQCWSSMVFSNYKKGRWDQVNK